MKPCKRCNGTGVWLPDGASEDDDPDVTGRACLRCDGSGEVPTMEEERAEWDLERRQGMFKRKRVTDPDEPTAAARAGPDAWLQLVQGWWAREREARIRGGACRACGERRCPKVGGPDLACVP